MHITRRLRYSTLASNLSSNAKRALSIGIALIAVAGFAACASSEGVDASNSGLDTDNLPYKPNLELM